MHRSDSAWNLHRFCRLDVQPDLLAAWCFIREWGRIGKSGQARIVPYTTSEEVQLALAYHRRKKEQKGYG